MKILIVLRAEASTSAGRSKEITASNIFEDLTLVNDLLSKNRRLCRNSSRYSKFMPIAPFGLPTSGVTGKRLQCVGNMRQISTA
jgi:hypothetical protein